jgi:N-ethylmaleimide reductase
VTDLFDPVRLGDLELANRIVMAPMTRSRAGAGDAPTAINVEYYLQRATAGLIVTEGTQPSRNGKGYCRTPGIHSEAQVAGWRAITDAVHGAGGCIALQVMHCGRVASRLNQDPDAEIVAPSALRAAVKIYTDVAGLVEVDAPRALDLAEIPSVIGEYGHAAANAVRAGFDGIELHAASGYLPMQFLSTGTNHRSDAYGGPVKNRIRFTVEALEAMAAKMGAGRVGIRIAPGNPFNDLQDDNPVETYLALLDAIAPLGLAYLHLVYLRKLSFDPLELVKQHWRGPLILNESLDFASGTQAIQDRVADAASYGRFFIGNPDLVRRFRDGAPLAPFNLKTIYSEGATGYTDYPPL